MVSSPIATSGHETKWVYSNPWNPHGGVYVKHSLNVTDVVASAAYSDVGGDVSCCDGTLKTLDPVDRLAYFVNIPHLHSHIAYINTRLTVSSSCHCCQLELFVLYRTRPTLLVQYYLLLTLNGRESNEVILTELCKRLA